MLEFEKSQVQWDLLFGFKVGITNDQSGVSKVHDQS